jgi:GT2 family glycosyltransferase
MLLKKPKISIIIPLAPYRHAEVLNSIKIADCNKKDYEIIVERGLNPSINRNVGAKKAKAEIILFLDDDAVVNKNIIKEVEKFFNENQEIGIVGGPQLTPADDNQFAKISGYALGSIFGGWKLSNRYKKGKLNLNATETSLTSANLACKKEVFKKIKFNPKLFPGEDPDFINQAKEKGIKVAYNPEQIVYHRRRNTLKGLVKQIYSYGKTRNKVNGIKTIKREIKDILFLIPSIFLLYILFLPLLITIHPAVVLPLFLYIIINLIFTLIISIRNLNPFALILLPFIFLIIHLTYGIGIIDGIFDKNEKNS